MHLEPDFVFSNTPEVKGTTTPSRFLSVKARNTTHFDSL